MRDDFNGCLKNIFINTLRFVTMISYDNSGNSVQDVPVKDQHYALCILLELAVQRATLSHLLEAILLLLHIWNKRKDQKDNR